ncbi:MAG: aminotransferase class III-fold pyridoxal phosphate-dependent enzyme [Deltaproteobacteria bacterium]|nr:aminotransferase class III-fold pyridoxal phosphate-dependent enzyme [Deltaproteobacteria bacterium]
MSLEDFEALALSPITITTALPGPVAAKRIAEAKQHMSPSLIHVYPLMVDRAAGCMVRDVDGNVFLDAQAGVAAASTGHCHPRIVEAMNKQAETLVHICGTDFFYPGYGDLCGRLGAHADAFAQAALGAPVGWQTFLTNSGTEAVEASLKLSRFHTRRTDFIAFRGGFHGRTYGSLSLTASKAKYRKHFGTLLSGVHHAPYGNADFIEKELFPRTVNPDDVAAIIVEPVLGEGGYIVPDVAFLQQLRAICDKHGIMLVFDEVQSGMGRTGRMFSAEHFGVVPDMFTLAKGLASGMPLGALVARKNVMTWPPGSHGSTCGGNPVCIASALATLDLLESGLVAASDRVGGVFRATLEERLTALPNVVEVRGLGLMIGVEFSTDQEADRISQECFARGLLVLECGDKAIRLSPPLIITESQAAAAAEIFVSVTANSA